MGVCLLAVHYSPAGYDRLADLLFLRLQEVRFLLPHLVTATIAPAGSPVEGAASITAP